MHATKIGLAGSLLIGFCLAIAARIGTADDAQGPKGLDVPAAEQGFQPMFDGKTLDGWDGDPRFWRVENGVIVGETAKANPAPANTFLIWRKDKPGDFEMRADFRMPNEGFANSGIQIRSWEGPRKWQVSGYQPDIDWQDQYTGIIYGENYRGILAGRGQKVLFSKDHQRKVLEQFASSEELGKFINKRGWNQYDIIAQGNHISQKVNGHLMCELTDEDTAARKDGIIALQIHAGPPMRVEFRNLQLKLLGKPVHAGATEAKKKIVFIAGLPSHGYAEHEYRAGCMLLAKWLTEGVPNVETVVYKNGWPADPAALDGAATVVISSDGGGGQPVVSHLDKMEKLMRKGVGLACIHFAVEVPKGTAGDDFLRWIGGYFEPFWLVNPVWIAHFKELPQHPVANGVKPFSIQDEWYFHMRFAPEMKGVTPILTAIPPDNVHRKGNDGYGANPYVFARKGMPEHVCWVIQRPDGGRGFGFTGGHWHANWGNRNFRTVVLNGIVWTAGLDVPPGGVPSKDPTFDELMTNFDKPQPANYDKHHVQSMLEQWSKEEGK